ncbi:MAG: ATP-NAD kinase [Euryarchaeota archaeon]|nr:ATP-NAD kinase [Euryarchaeota archaeon]
MGGRVGLKGTDGVVDEAIKRGAVPVAPEKATLMLRALREARDVYGARFLLRWKTAGGLMGERELVDAGWSLGEFEVVYRPPERSSPADTRAACEVMMGLKTDLILFCGGDGTARDIFETVGVSVPILGIPSGVKMHSGVFGLNPVIVSEIVQEFLDGRLGNALVEILDLDEELYRKGEWRVRLFGQARTPHEPNYIQAGKLMIESESDDEVKEGIAEHMLDKLGAMRDALWILGPGSTLETIGRRLGIEKTLLGVDAVFGGELVAKDADERTLLGLLERHPRAVLVLSPIGAQGFVLGRGNLQLSPAVIRKVGLDNIIITATPSKLSRTPVLRVDTGDEELDRELDGKSFFVVTGFRQVTLRAIVAEGAGRRAQGARD